MADQNSPQGGRRPHFHRGRRGSERRGTERRAPQHQPHEQHAGRDHVDVEQIMRDIRARISQRHGIELSSQQIEELAARRLEAILEPRNVRPALFEQLRRSAAEPFDAAPVAADGGYSFEDTTLYESNNGLLRAIRRLLNPILKLFFDPHPLAHALNTQVRINKEASARDAARDRTQAEWNALHYEVLQRLVTEVSRVSLEMQTLSLRIESLGAKVDFNERRVRGLEQQAFQPRPHAPRPFESAAAQSTSATEPATADGATSPDGSSEGSRRRRRRRRGRRGGSGMMDGAPASSDAHAAALDAQENDELEGDEGDGPDTDVEPAAAPQAESEIVVSHEPAIAMSPLQPSEPHASEATAPEAPSLAAPVPAAEPPRDAAVTPEPTPPTQPTPPRDEPLPPAPVDHADPGPTDR